MHPLTASPCGRQSRRKSVWLYLLSAYMTWVRVSRQAIPDHAVQSLVHLCGGFFSIQSIHQRSRESRLPARAFARAAENRADEDCTSHPSLRSGWGTRAVMPRERKSRSFDSRLAVLRDASPQDDKFWRSASHPSRQQRALRMGHPRCHRFAARCELQVPPLRAPNHPTDVDLSVGTRFAQDGAPTLTIARTDPH